MTQDEITKALKDFDCIIFVGDDSTGYTCWHNKNKSVIAEGATKEQAYANLIELEKFTDECQAEIKQEGQQ